MKSESYNNIQISKINKVHAYLNIISYLSNASDQVWGCSNTLLHLFVTVPDLPPLLHLFQDILTLVLHLPKTPLPPPRCN